MDICTFKHFKHQLQSTVSVCALMAVALCFSVEAKAQLSSNPDKFLGNITTSYNVDYGNEPFYTLWNQITCENESKWGSVEGNSRGSFNWGCDNAYNYAKRHNFPFKFHCLIWGAQYPNWLNNLSTQEQYKAIEEWFDAVAQRYPDLPMIDVVNEAVAGHQPAPYKNALGGDGKTGIDWIIKAFEMAHERWPDAILIYNDYNTFQWQQQEFIDLCKILRDSGAPIDAYGCQSHDLTDMSLSNFKTAMTNIQNELKMPMYSTEYDIGTSDDAQQLQRYQEQIPYMWESDYCAGVTIWGYIYGRTWTTDGNSGLIRNGVDRPAMTWLREYMQSDAAKNAKSPFPGMVKEASVYVKCASLNLIKGETENISMRARLKTKTIDHIDLYVNDQLLTTFTGEPYSIDYVPENAGRYNVKAVVVATDGTQYERYSGFNAFNPRVPFAGEIELPGTLEAENFDSGAESIAYHDSDNKNEGGTNYRDDCPGVDIVTGNGGYAIGYTSSGEWLEYTINVKEAGVYSYDASVSSGATNSSFNLELSTADGQVKLTDNIAVPCVQSNNWDNYRVVHGRLLVPLEAGTQILRINITGSSCNIDKIVFNHVDVDENINISLTANPDPAIINENTTLTVIAASPTSDIVNVKIYENSVLAKTLTAEPFEYNRKFTTKGTYNIMAIATDAQGRQSKIASLPLMVNNRRSAFKGVIALPGTIQAEDFDKGGEDFTFHDSDSQDEGGANYRNDNEGVDIITCGSGYGIGYTAQNEWLEYTVNVTKPGKYLYDAVVSSGLTNSGFSINLSKNGSLTSLCRVSVPQTGNNSWDTYKTVSGTVGNLEAGEQVIRFVITGAYCNIDNVTFKLDPTGIEMVTDNEQQSSGNIYNLYGIKVGENYKGVIIKNGKKYLNK